MKLNNAESVVQQKRSLRARGIGYDTGFSFDGVTRRPFDHEVVRRELQIIRDDLHCTAVRLFGDDLDRLEFAARHAADLGLEVWFSPFTYQLGPEEMLNFSPTARSAPSGSAAGEPRSCSLPAPS